MPLNRYSNFFPPRCVALLLINVWPVVVYFKRSFPTAEHNVPRWCHGDLVGAHGRLEDPDESS